MQHPTLAVPTAIVLLRPIAPSASVRPDSRVAHSKAASLYSSVLRNHSAQLDRRAWPVLASHVVNRHVIVCHLSSALKANVDRHAQTTLTAQPAKHASTASASQKLVVDLTKTVVKD